MAPLKADGLTVAMAPGFVECEKGKDKNLNGIEREPDGTGLGSLTETC